MKKLTCIVCPNGCKLEAEQIVDSIIVTGNKCKRGEAYAVSELTCPMRTVCSTVRTAFLQAPVLPVRTSSEIPKARIFDIMKEINSIYITTPVKRGEVLIKNVLGLDSDIIVTSDLIKEAEK